MNNEFNQNTRTLIVSFVFALMVMVPLRFVEFGNTYSDSAVLGESIEVSIPKIEAPFDVIDDPSSSCIPNDYADKAVDFLNKELGVKGLTTKQIDSITTEIVGFENSRCN